VIFNKFCFERGTENDVRSTFAEMQAILAALNDALWSSDKASPACASKRPAIKDGIPVQG